MRWARLALFALPGLLLYPVALAAMTVAVPPAPIPWEVTFPADRIPSGAPAELTVIGPPGDSFIVQITAPPWNGTSPVFTGQYVLPNATTIPPRATARNITLTTAPLSIAEYQVQVQYNGLLVASGWFWITTPVNETVLNNTVSQVYGQLIVDQTILLGDRQQIAQLEQLEQIQWWACIGSAAASLVGMAIAVSLTRRPASEATRSFREQWHSLFWGDDQTILASISGRREIPPAPTPEKEVYRSTYCFQCRNLLWTEPEIRLHLERAHPDVLGPAGPTLGKHYSRDERAVADAERPMQPRTEPRPKRDLARERRSLAVPFREES